jgi:arginyl-tRNA synthetase
MTPAELAAAVTASVRAAVDAGELALDPAAVPAQVTVERPKVREHGDYATNVAMQLAKPVGRPPREIASVIAPYLAALPGIAHVDVAGPGFLNVVLEPDAQGALAAAIVREGIGYGRSQAPRIAGRSVNLEFISANPTGPLHLGHARWAAVGDAMARVLEAAGAKVAREFYINDRGVQLDRFGESLAAAAAGEPTPKDGYHGAYVGELAAQIAAEHPEFSQLTGTERLEAFREAGYGLQLAEQQRVLDEFRTHFDIWYSERSLHDSGAVDRGLAKLREQGHMFSLDGAIWLRTTDFGDDKDRVLVKADGELTYFASDTAYYVDKRSRGFDLCIYLLGADHHGYVDRLRAVAACAGDDPDQTIQVLIGQLVRIMRGDVEVRMSKRAGDIITLEELVEEVGVDAARYSLCRYPVDSPLTLDLEVLTAQRNENHVYYVQYAHARVSRVIRNAAALGMLPDLDEFDPALIGHERESDLLGQLGEFPRVVATAAELREPHRIARYLEDLAGVFHRFYDDDACRVLPSRDSAPEPVNRARLVLCAATRQVLGNGLDLLGVSAPDRM